MFATVLEVFIGNNDELLLGQLMKWLQNAFEANMTTYSRFGAEMPDNPRECIRAFSKQF